MILAGKMQALQDDVAYDIGKVTNVASLVT